MTTPANLADLITWLRVQLDTDEQDARAADREATNGYILMLVDRTLAEVDAKRRILDLCEVMEPDLAFLSAGSLYPGDEKEMATRVLMLTALPYADHPDYREEWRP